MTSHTRQLFERVGPAPRERTGHRITIEIRGATINIDCSCGKSLGGGRGCNRSGMDYCIAWSKDAYKQHIRGIIR